jgi:hypothetical protein
MHKSGRSDAVLELAVRYGIILDYELGAVSAWAFMAANGVNEAVILRVLLSPESRREADRLVLGIADRERGRMGKETVRAIFGLQHHAIVQ